MFMGFSPPQLSADNYFIGQNYPDGPPNFLGLRNVGSIFDQELLSPAHAGGTKASKRKMKRLQARSLKPGEGETS